MAILQSINLFSISVVKSTEARRQSNTGQNLLEMVYIPITRFVIISGKPSGI